MENKILLKLTRLFFLVLTLGLTMGVSLNALGQATVTTDRDDYQPGDYVIITGSGWQPNETVSFHFEEDPKPATCVNPHDLVAVADENGNIYNDQFLVKENHLGVTFTLTATGQSSGLVATTVFTDALLFSATITSNPATVCAGTLATYTINITNNTTAPPTGSNARLGSVRIEIPPGFTAISITNNSSNWTASTVSSPGFIDFDANGNGDRINPNQSVFVTFSATTPPSPSNPYEWTTQAWVGDNFGLVQYPAIGSVNNPGNQPSVTVNASTVINSGPANSNITYGADASFSVTATGSGTLTYQWEEFNGLWSSISNGGIYSGSNTSTLTLTKPGVALSGRQYRVKVTGDCGTIESSPATLTVNAKEITGNFTADNKVYDGNNSATVLTRTLNGVISPDAVTLTGGTATFSDEDVANGKTVTLTGATLSGADAGNYSLGSVATTTANITPASLTITANDETKYSGQANPDFTVTYDGFVNGEDEVVLGGTLAFGTSADVNSCAGDYDIVPSGLTSNNYIIYFYNGTLTVFGLTIDASASSTPVAINTNAVLKATVSPAIEGVSISFYLDGVFKGTSLTGADPIDDDGTARLVVSGLAADVYEVKALIGDDDQENICAESIVYLPVYDPSGGFVTGGGWIDSPAGAMTGDKAEVVGKANFGFNAKYKTGKNNTTEVDGNTNFQFKAGDLHFSSSIHDAMQLVISGAKATYTGTGTVNGVGNHKFRVVAIDGQVTGGGGFDKFRIMIWDNNSSSTLLYDNKRGISESSDDATIIGGGSIVIHKPAAKGNKRVSTELITVAWNTPIETVKQKVDQMSAGWFESRKLAMTLDAGAYDPLTPGIYELKADVVENEFFTLDEPISIQVLVQDKPMALDITLENGNLSREPRAGEVLGYLNTIDPVDNIHTYQIEEHEDLMLDGDKLIWRGTTVPAQLRLTVFSTDRAGQTISREIKLSRELKPGEFFLYPNPAHRETNVMVDMDVDATVAIRIYDAIGRLVFENEAYREGSFTQTFNLDGLAAGFYNVQVKVGDMVMTKRLIIK